MSVAWKVPVSSIVVRDGRRALRDTTALEDSMAEVGLLNPIAVRAGDPPVLIAGHHRLAAAKNLGWESIFVVVLNVSDLQAELAEIDENLQRNELDALERDLAMARRKSLYLELHPETAHGAAGGTAKARNRSTTLPNSVVEPELSFVADTAAKTGQAESTIRQHVQVGNSLEKSGAAEKLLGTPVAKRQKELLYLSKMDAEKQNAIADTIKSGEATSVYEAEKKLKGVPDRTSEECNVFVLDQLEQGASLADIAEALGVHRNSLDHRMKTKAFLDLHAARTAPEPEPVSPPPPPTPIRGNADAVRKLWEQGKPATEIQQLTGLQMATVQKHLQPLMEAARPAYTGPTREEAQEAHPLTEIIEGLERALEVQSWSSVLTQINNLKHYRNKEALCA